MLGPKSKGVLIAFGAGWASATVHQLSKFNKATDLVTPEEPKPTQTTDSVTPEEPKPPFVYRSFR